MHKVFYASGFLYHSPTQQILLQQLNKDDSTLTIFSGKNSDSETSEITFQRIIDTQLGVHLPLHTVKAVYDYDVFGEHHYLLYAEVGNASVNYSKKNNRVTRWCPLKHISKLQLSQQTRQDIIVGERVINLLKRERLEKEMFSL